MGHKGVNGMAATKGVPYRMVFSGETSSTAETDRRPTPLGVRVEQVLAARIRAVVSAAAASATASSDLGVMSVGLPSCGALGGCQASSKLQAA